MLAARERERERTDEDEHEANMSVDARNGMTVKVDALLIATTSTLAANSCRIANYTYTQEQRQTAFAFAL